MARARSYERAPLSSAARMFGMPSGRFGGAMFMAAAGALVLPASAQDTVLADLCTGNPCNVTASVVGNAVSRRRQT